MQGFLITIATAVILAIGSAFAAPFVVDWNAWRASFENEASRIAGVPVLIRGPIEAELLPAPRLTLRAVSFGADGVASGGTVDVLKAEFSLGSLLRGQWEARGVELVRPKIRLVLDTAGRIVAPTGTGAPGSLVMDRVVLQDGTLDLLERAANRTIHVSDLDLRGEMRSLSGPLRFEGEAEAGGQRHAVRLSLSKPGEEGTRLRFITEAKEPLLSADLDGILRLEGGIPRFEGRGVLAKGGRPPAELPWRLSGTVRLSPEALVAEALEAALGDEARPLQLTGSARLSFGRALGLDMVLNGRAVDADPLLANGNGARTPVEALAAVGHLFADLPSPAFPMRIGAAVDQLTLGGTVVRDARLDLTGLPSGWRIDTAEAKLPGQTVVRLSGTPSSVAGTTFSGELSLASQEPATFLRWAAPQGAGDYVAAFGAPVRLSARLFAGAERIAAEAIKLDLGGAQVTGGATLALSSPPRLAIDLGLERLDLAPLIAAARTGLAASGGRIEGAVALQGKDLRLSGLPLGRLALKAESADAGWVLKQLSIEDLAGLRIDGGGLFARLSPPVEGDLALNLSGGGADGLVPLARLVAGSEAGDVMARLVPVAAPVALRSRARWSAGGNEISADGTLGILSGRAILALGRNGAPEKAEVAVSATDAARALGAAGIADLRPGLGAGRLDVSLVPGAAGTGAKFEGRAVLAETTATGTGTVRFTADGALEPRLRATVESPDLAGVFTLVSSLNIGAVPARLGFELSKEAGAWRLGGIEGAVGGAPVSGAISLETGGPLPRLSGTLSTDALSLPRIIGLWGARTSAQDAGTAPWSAARLDLANPPQAALSVSLTAKRLALTSAYDLANGQFRLVSEPQSLEIRDLSGSLGGGTVSGALTLRRRTDSLAGDGRIALEGVTAAALLAPLSMAAPPEGRVNLALDLGGVGRSPLLFIQSLSGQGTLGVSRLTIPAADPHAIAAILADTATGAPPAERRTAQMFDRALQRGPLKLDEVEGALSIVNGTARLTPARASVTGSTGEPVRATFTGSFEAARLLMDISLALDSSEPGGADAGGIIQWRGPVAGPERRVSAVALANAIAMRAIERETRRLEERHGISPAPATGAAPAEAMPAPPGGNAPASGTSTGQAPPAPATPAQSVPAPSAPAPPAAAPSSPVPPASAATAPAPSPSAPARTTTAPARSNEARPSPARPAEPRQGQAAAGSAPPLAPPQDIQPLARPQAVRPELDDLPYRAPNVSGFGIVPRPPAAIPGD